MNELLRAHVTRVGFDLSLGHTHVAALVQLDVTLKRNGPRIPKVGAHHDQWIVAVQGLERRGLVVHHYNKAAAMRQQKRPLETWSLRPHFSITPAGRIVIALLKEAGLYAEYAQSVGIRVA